MKILIAPDKFKGSLSAAQAAGAIRRGLEKALPGAVCRELPIADGGEGTAEVLCAAAGGEWVTAAAHDPNGAPVEAGYGWLPGEVAVVSVSAASGLWRIPAEQRDLLRASTFGTGELLLDAIQRGARKILVGLGGSATNDGGFGLAAALGYRFLDGHGIPLPPAPYHLGSLAHIVAPETAFPEMQAMCDVENPLLGPRGATWIYGRQKGGDGETLPQLEAALERLADVVRADLGCDYGAEPGAGAAGGVGFGLMSFCGARLCSGFELVAATMQLETAIAGNDLIITGEGCLDHQTLHGKGPAGVAALARKLGKPVVAFAGRIIGSEALRTAFDGAYALQADGMPLEAAMREAELLLELRAAQCASELPALAAAGASGRAQSA